MGNGAAGCRSAQPFCQAEYLGVLGNGGGGDRDQRPGCDAGRRFARRVQQPGWEAHAEIRGHHGMGVPWPAGPVGAVLPPGVGAVLLRFTVSGALAAAATIVVTASAVASVAASAGWVVSPLAALWGWAGNGRGTPDASINDSQSTTRSSAAELWAETLLRESECWHFWVKIFGGQDRLAPAI